MCTQTSEHSAPPPLPPECVYTSCWCEENIYDLAWLFSAHKQLSGWDIFVVFISNDTKTVALWKQKAARGAPPNDVVVWDYHVVLVLRPAAASDPAEQGSWIYDLDTRLNVPCRSQDYTMQTFHDVAPQYQSLFRVIPADVFLDNFASDRSHMLLVDPDGLKSGNAYASPPPEYPALCGEKSRGKGISNNLMASFVSMIPSEESFGYVLQLEEFVLWLD